MLIVSGASDSVIPSGECSDAPTVETIKSRNGCAYEVAGGHRILDVGENEITSVSQGG